MYGPGLRSSVWDHRSHAGGDRLEGHGDSQFYESREEDRRSSSACH